MKTNLLLAATAAFAVAAPSAANANNCATIVPADSKGAALHTTWYGQCLTNDFSFGVWAKGLKSTYGCYPFDSQNAKLQRGSGSQDLFFITTQVNSSDGTTTSVKATLAKGRSILEDESWHFYCCTFHYDETEPTASFQRLYIDGTLKAEKSGAEIIGPVAAPTSGNHVTLAGNWHPNGWANYCAKAGSVSEITVWSKALTASEVSALCARRAGGFEDGLVVYWPLAGTSVTEPNRANGGPAATLAVHRDGSGTFAMANDPDFPLDNTRCVASAEWIAEHGYVQSADATFRSWDDPATNIATAFAAAIPGETILLMPGTHPISEQIDITKANITFAHGPGDGEAVIDAQGLCRHFRSDSSSSGKSGFVFENLTFANGKSSDDGGAMYFKSNTGVMRSCTFRGNAAAGNGGAIYTQHSSANDCIVVDCVVTNNSAQSGGGIYAHNCIGISGCFFADNKANTEGNTFGGNVRIGMNSTISNCTFTGACQAKYGSCIEVGGANATVADCDFAGLAPSGFDGGHYGVISINGVAGFAFADCVATNITFSRNTRMFWAENSGASFLARQSLFDASVPSIVANFNGGKSRFENCTILSPTFDIKANTSGQNVLVNCIVPNADITSSGNFVNIITNSLVKSVTGGTQDSGVMTGTPKFADAVNGDYHLAATSSCREKGLVLDWMSGATDLDGNPRLVNILGRVAADALPDLGCYECQEVGIQPTVIYVR